MHSLSRARFSLVLTVAACAALIVAAALPAGAAGPSANSQRPEHAQAEAKDPGSRSSATGKAQRRRGAPSQGRGGEAAQARGDNRSPRANAAQPSNGTSTAAKAEGSDEPRPAAQDGPAGNKGSIKVRPVGTAAHPPRTYAHLPCEVQVDFYGVPHDSATLTARSHAPSAPTGQTLRTTAVSLSASSPNPPGNERVGSTTLDFSGVVDGLTYHEQQGYHVKLTAEIDGPQGANLKHKVFWIDCPQPDSTAADQTHQDSGDSPELTEQQEQQTVQESADVAAAPASPALVERSLQRSGDLALASGGTRPAARTRTIGAVASGAGAGGLVGGSRVLAQTGLGAVVLALLGLAGIGLGTTLVRRRR